VSETLRIAPEGLDALLEKSISPCNVCGTPVSVVTVDTGVSRVTRTMEAVQDRDDRCLFHLSPHDCTPVVLPVAAVKEGNRT
jgi:hypothetical protein